MKNCKYCNAEMPEDSTVCPSCGKDNAQALSAGKSVLAAVAFVLVLILVAAVVLHKPAAALHQSAAAQTEEEALIAREEAVEMTTEPTEPPTVPADGNPDDITCKGTYTVTEEEALAAKDTVVATAGDFKLTQSQLQTYYWMEVRNFLSQYGAYAAYMGLDYQQSLDTQVCTALDNRLTWQQYFLDSALKSWGNYTAMVANAETTGFAIPETIQAQVDGIAADLEEAAVANGFASADEIIHNSLGSSVSIDDYRYFMDLYYRASAYYSHLADQVHPADEELDAFYDAHAEDYAASGITKDAKYVDVRHILIYPEGADGTNIFTGEFGEEAWAAGEAQAQAILEEWLAGEKTEESFAALANERSADPGSNKNGGLYENVTDGEMVQAFNDWCFDAARQVGDTGIVKTEYGYHVMFYSGSRPVWKQYVESDIIKETVREKMAAIAADYPMTVDYSAIVLGSAVLN